MADSVETPAVENDAVANVASVSPGEVFSPTPQFPDRGLIMPPSDDYYVVGRDKLQRLNEERSGWIGQGLTLAIGVAIPCAINAQTAKDDGTSADDAFYWNSIGAAGGLVAFVLLLVIALSRRNRFKTTIQEIESGKPFRLTEKGFIEVAAKPIEGPTSPILGFLSRLMRRETGSRTSP